MVQVVGRTCNKTFDFVLYRTLLQWQVKVIVFKFESLSIDSRKVLKVVVQVILVNNKWLATIFSCEVFEQAYKLIVIGHLTLHNLNHFLAPRDVLLRALYLYAEV